MPAALALFSVEMPGQVKPCTWDNSQQTATFAWIIYLFPPSPSRLFRAALIMLAQAVKLSSAD